MFTDQFVNKSINYICSSHKAIVFLQKTRIKPPNSYGFILQPFYERLSEQTFNRETGIFLFFFFFFFAFQH